MPGNPLVPLVMFGWLPLVFFLFAQYPPQRALLISFTIAWLLLPQANLALPLIPDYGRVSATCYGVLLATLVFDSTRLISFKPSWIDIPLFAWCLCPFLTSLSNDLGAYDGLNVMLQQTMDWGMPYFLGRLYLGNFDGLRKLATTIFIGGLVYVPFCLIESRLSVSLHLLIYGFQHPSQTFMFAIRYGGYRPSVFLESGLMLGVWLMAATLMGFVLWRSKNLTELWGVPVGVWVGILTMTFVLQRSTGAYALLVFGLITLFTAKWFKTPLGLWAMVGLICAFLYLGATGEFPRKELIGALSQVFQPDRIQSLDFRFMNEEILGEKARQRWLLGWGGFGRNRVYDEYGSDITITDSLWIIVFGINGLIGLVSAFSFLMFPAIAFSFRYPARLWSHRMVAPAAALAVSTILYAFDCVLNAMQNPFFALIGGAIASVVVNPKPAETTEAV